uniref:Putative APETALA3-LIKE protein n=1 Tax=Papaver somniferum TaxID=3469 RepID=A0A481S7G3_PAPSO|nr:putative APETALA3-LIKE protein [Papaver somniferum]
MGRRSGKLVIKYIENSTNRKVTYSKRKKGILKKARELTILCNAQVCVIMLPKSGKNAEYVSPSITMKDFLDRYQRETNTSLWEAQYERTGQEDDLSEFSIEELGSLEKNLEESLEIVRDRKEHVLTSQANTLTRKSRLASFCSVSQVRFLEETRTHLLRLYAKKVEPCYPVPADNEGYHYLDFVSMTDFTNFSMNS